MICLEVRDDGPGVAEESLSRLHDRFFRGTNHVEKGSGLGLSIVARIVARLRVRGIASSAGTKAGSSRLQRLHRAANTLFG